jgi:hypothetical protein
MYVQRPQKSFQFKSNGKGKASDAAIQLHLIGFYVQFKGLCVSSAISLSLSFCFSVSLPLWMTEFQFTQEDEEVCTCLRRKINFITRWCITPIRHKHTRTSTYGCVSLLWFWSLPITAVAASSAEREKLFLINYFSMPKLSCGNWNILLWYIT